jgi:hypothetical protein
VELVFLMGASSLQAVNARDLLEEGEKHGDMLVADMHDSYDNLTLKMVTGFHWLAAHCDMQRVRHVLKADTDTFVHADMLLHVLEHLTDTQPEVAQNAILGDVVCSAPFSGYLCNERDSRAYPFRTYPPYAAGPSYLLPGHHVPRMAAVSRGLPLLSAEDAFLTGLVAQSLGMPRLHMRGVLGINAVRHVCRPAPCLMLGDGRVETPVTKLTDTDVSMTTMREIWRAVKAGPGFCRHHATLWNRVCKGLHRWADRYWPF